MPDPKQSRIHRQYIVNIVNSPCKGNVWLVNLPFLWVSSPVGRRASAFQSALPSWWIILELRGWPLSHCPMETAFGKCTSPWFGCQDTTGTLLCRVCPWLFKRLTNSSVHGESCRHTTEVDFQTRTKLVEQLRFHDCLWVHTLLQSLWAFQTHGWKAAANLHYYTVFAPRQSWIK